MMLNTSKEDEKIVFFINNNVLLTERSATVNEIQETGLFVEAVMMKMKKKYGGKYNRQVIRNMVN